METYGKGREGSGLLERNGSEAGRLIVGSASLVAVDNHEAVSGAVGNLGTVGAVHGDLVVVSSQSVTLGVGVGEESSLKHLIGRGLDSGNHMAGGEGDLLDLGEVVIGVLVEDQLSDALERVVGMGPHLGNVKDVPLVGGGVGLRHDLDLEAPGGAFTGLDVVEEFASGEVGVLALHLLGLFGAHVLDAGVGLEVELDVEDLTLGVDPTEGVTAVSVHVAVSVRGTTIGEEDADLVSTLGGQTPEIPGHVAVLAVGLGVSLLGVDEVRELDGVSNEEDGGVVSNHVPVALLSVELDGKTSGVSLSVGRSLFSSDGGETYGDGSSLSDGVEEVSMGELGDVVCDFEVPEGSGALGVDDSFGDSLPVEVGQLVDEGKVLEKEGAVLSGTGRVLVVVNGVSV